MLDDRDELSLDFRRGTTIGMMAALNYIKRLHDYNAEIRGSEMMFFLGHEIQRLLPELVKDDRAMAVVNKDIDAILSRCRCNLQ